MFAKSAAPVFRAVVGAREKFAPSRRGDDLGRPLDPQFCEPGVVGQSEVQRLARISVDDADQRWIQFVEKVLIERRLARVARKGSCESVTRDRAKVFGVERFVLPDTGGRKIGSGQARRGDNHAVRMALQVAIESDELARLTVEPNTNPALMRRWRVYAFEIVPAIEDRAHPRRQKRLRPPGILRLAQALMADSRRAEITREAIPWSSCARCAR